MIKLASGREVILVGTALILVILLYMMIIQGEKRKKLYPIRRLPAMDAMEEAVGRAVEMQRPIHYVPGTGALNRLEATSTLAGLTLLSYVAGLAAKTGARIITTCQVADVYPLTIEIVRQAFQVEGQTDMFREEDCLFMPQEKSAAGLIQRERVAANFLIGAFWHESLVLIEAGARAGAMNIGGAAYTLGQIPFLVSCCDYCLVGEEVYAASAYITKDPSETSVIAGQDYIKLIGLGFIILGTLLSTMGLTVLYDLFRG